MDEQALNEKYPGRTVYREGDRIVVTIPVRFRRRNGRQMIFSKNGGTEEQGNSDNHALVMALAKAYQWQEQLESGEFATIEDLANDNQVDASYVRRILRLNSLAPDIVEAILAGEEPSGISLRSLYRGIPLSWDEQRNKWA